MAFKYRADHVGSFLRPKELLDARVNPEVNPEQLREMEDRHILRILERQRDLGFKVFTDGELRRRGFMSDFNESVAGMDNQEEIARSWKAGSGAVALSVSNRLPGVVSEKIRQKKRLTRHEVGFLQQHSPGGLPDLFGIPLGHRSYHQIRNSSAGEGRGTLHSDRRAAL